MLVGASFGQKRQPIHPAVQHGARYGHGARYKFMQLTSGTKFELKIQPKIRMQGLEPRDTSHRQLKGCAQESIKLPVKYIQKNQQKMSRCKVLTVTGGNDRCVVRAHRTF